MRKLLRFVLIAAGAVGLGVTFREETTTHVQTAAGVEGRFFRQKTEIGLAFSPWYIRTTDTDRKPVVEEEINLLSWSVPGLCLSLGLIWLSFRLERTDAKSPAPQSEEGTW